MGKRLKLFEEFINEAGDPIKYHFKKNENKVILIGSQAGKDSEFVKTFKSYLEDGGYFEGAQFTKNKHTGDPMSVFEFSGDKKDIENELHRFSAVTKPTITNIFKRKDYGIKESLNEEKVADEKQEKILIDTIKNPDKSLMGGPDAKEAEETLKKKFNYSDDDIKKLKESKHKKNESINELDVGDKVTVPKSLTKDPANKKGETGKIKKIDKDGTVHVEFDDDVVGKYADIEIFEKSINEASVEQSFSVGDKVMIHPDNDNENYDDYRDTTLIITDVATDSKDHPGFDDFIGQALYDLQTKNGDNVPFSLYDFELVEA